MYVYECICIHVYIYIYAEREREILYVALCYDMPRDMLVACASKRQAAVFLPSALPDG